MSNVSSPVDTGVPTLPAASVAVAVTTTFSLPSNAPDLAVNVKPSVVSNFVSKSLTTVPSTVTVTLSFAPIVNPLE